MVAGFKHAQTIATTHPIIVQPNNRLSMNIAKSCRFFLRYAMIVGRKAKTRAANKKQTPSAICGSKRHPSENIFAVAFMQRSAKIITPDTIATFIAVLTQSPTSNARPKPGGWSRANTGNASCVFPEGIVLAGRPTDRGPVFERDCALPFSDQTSGQRDTVSSFGRDG